MTTEATPGELGSNEWLGGSVPKHELLAWLRNDFERGLSSQGCEAAADEIERLRADYDRVLALQQASYEREIQGEVEIERERWLPLLVELQLLAERCEWPDGDGAQVIAQMWAEEWVQKLKTPNVVLSGAREEDGEAR